MRRFVTALLAHGLLFLALAAVLFGVSRLEWRPALLGQGYAFLFLGAAVLVFLPQQFSLSAALKGEWRIAAVLSAVLSLVLAGKELAFVLADSNPGPYPLLPMWGAAILLLLFACFSVDRERSVAYGVPVRDAWVAAGIFAIALAVRAFGPDVLVGDEIIHTHRVMMIPENPNAWVLGAMGDDGYPYVFLYLQTLLYRIFAPITDVITFQKWLSYVCGALSVMFFYLVVRMRSGVNTAVCTALLLCFFGWHWVNSRFIYAYPPDLAVIAFGLLALTVAFRRRSLVYAALSGLALSAALILQKGGMLLVPVFGYLFLEEFLAFKGRERRFVVLLACVTAVAFLIGYEPYLIQHMQGTYQMPLQAIAMRQRAELLPKLGFTPYSATAYMFWDAAMQLQVSINDFYRHMFRPRAPILDPMFSVLFSVGLLQCLGRLWKSQAARLCVLGLVVFVVPMAMSFPVNDMERGVARRMIGISFFLAWMGAFGAEQIARRFFVKSVVPGTALVLCGISALSNIWMFYGDYQKVGGGEWYSPAGRGLQSKAILNLVLNAEASRIPTVVMEGYEASVFGVPDSRVRRSSTLTPVSSVAEVRSLLLSRPGVLQLVVLPWDTQTIQRDSGKAVEELSDIVPPYLWIAGAPDQDGIPMLRYAYVRIKS